MTMSITALTTETHYGRTHLREQRITTTHDDLQVAKDTFWGPVEGTTAKVIRIATWAGIGAGTGTLIQPGIGTGVGAIVGIAIGIRSLQD